MSQPLQFPNRAVNAMYFAFAGTATLLALHLAFGSPPSAERYLDVLNGVVALVSAVLVASRIAHHFRLGNIRIAWIIAFIALSMFAGMQWYEATAARDFGGEDLSDGVLAVALPAAILVAAHSERLNRYALLLLLAGSIAQAAAVGLEALDRHAIGNAASEARTEQSVDFSEFIFLQLYFAGLAALAIVERRGTQPEPRTAPPPSRRGGKRLFSPNRVYYWYIQPRLWHLLHPGGKPEDYYSSMIVGRIHRGSFHPAIGPTARAVRAPTELLDILQASGLRPEHTVVDYGCGSFRLGRALIEHLEPGKYWGLDVAEEFLRMGIAHLGPKLIGEKRPHALRITETSLAAARAAGPDYIVSWHVCSKVPPSRQADYFGKIISLMGPRTIALVHFPETDRRMRQSRFSWSETRSSISKVIHGIDPTLDVSFSLVTETVSREVRQSMVRIQRKHA